MTIMSLDQLTRGSSILPLLERLEAGPRGGYRVAEIGRTLKALDEVEREQLKRFLFLTHSPTVTFGMKSLPQPPFVRDGDVWIFHEWWMGLESLLNRLATRDLSGNAAFVAVTKFLSRCDRIQMRWTERVIRQDLRLNIGAKEINKAAKEAGMEPIVPTFEVPLATDVKKVKLEKVLPMSATWVLQPKLDGGRCIAVCRRDGSVELLSRTGKAWKNFESIRKALQAWNRSPGRALFDNDIVIDGEVVSLREDGSIDFQSIQKTMMRGDGVEVGHLRYVIFDACGLGEWFAPSENYIDRLEFAATLAGQISLEALASGFDDRITIVPSTTVAADGVEALAKTLHDEYVTEGYEGLMIRAANHTVENKRGKLLLKMKQFQDREAIIRKCVEGTGKYAGMLGALECTLGQSATEGPVFEIGSGFNDAQRTELWSRRDVLPGEVANFKFFELTDDGIPRFPIFRSLRSKDDCEVATGAEGEE